ncbi:MAG: hypothetical protein ACI9MR_003171 [Myxococcota bacterium]|jgi:hypothetical protein
MRQGSRLIAMGCLVALGLLAAACGGKTGSAEALAQQVVAAVGAEDLTAASAKLVADEDVARAAFEKLDLSVAKRSDALARLPRVVSRNRVRVRTSVERVRTQLDGLGLDAATAVVENVEVERQSAAASSAARVRLSVRFANAVHALSFYAADIDGAWFVQGPIEWQIPEFVDPFQLGTELTHELYDVVEKVGGDVEKTTAAIEPWLVGRAQRLSILDAALARKKAKSRLKSKSDNRHPYREQLARDLQARTEKLAASFPAVMEHADLKALVSRLLPVDPEKKPDDGHGHKPGDGHTH